MEIKINNQKINIYTTDSNIFKDIKIIDDINSTNDKIIIRINKDYLKETEKIKNIMLELFNKTELHFTPFIEGYKYTPPKVHVVFWKTVRGTLLVLPINEKLKQSIQEFIGEKMKKIETKYFEQNPKPLPQQGIIEIIGDSQKNFQTLQSILSKYNIKLLPLGKNKNKYIEENKTKLFLNHFLLGNKNTFEKIEIIKNIIKSGGLISKELRKETGINSNGIGSFDEYGGGSNYVFFRLSNEKDIGDLVFSIEPIEIPNSIIHQVDAWGDTTNNNIRLKPEELNELFIGEVLIPHFVPLKYLLQINVNTEEEKQMLIKKLKEEGIEKINDKNLEEVIKVKSSTEKGKEKHLKLLVRIFSFVIYPSIGWIDKKGITSKILRKIYDKLV